MGLLFAALLSSRGVAVERVWWQRALVVVNKGLLRFESHVLLKRLSLAFRQKLKPFHQRFHCANVIELFQSKLVAIVSLAACAEHQLAPHSVYQDLSRRKPTLGAVLVLQ